MTITNPYGDFDDDTGGVVHDVSEAGYNEIKNNFPAAMVVTGGVVLWKVGKRVIKSIV